MLFTRSGSVPGVGGNGDSVPAQPTLYDGDLVLRPWTDADVEPARLQHDEEMAHWFGFDQVVPSADAHRAWVEACREAYRQGRRTVVFAIEHRGAIAGTVDVKQRGDGVGELSWAVYPVHRGQRLATRAVRMLIGYCFDALGLQRVEAKVEVGNAPSMRTAHRVGLRQEGIARSLETVGDRRPDFVWLARLAGDPPPTSGEGFRGVLNATLPRKRVISQGLMRNPRGEVLLCELTYKREWDLPGGVVDPGEPPSSAVAREVKEELGIDVEVGTLRVVDWMPPWHGWDDACLFVFDLGTYPDGVVAEMVFEPREIAAVHWCSPEQAEPHLPEYAHVLLRRLLDGPETTTYLENGRPV